MKDDFINIDPQLLFQRLVTAGTRNDNLAEVFEYELCSFPPALFENRTTPRASLADALWKLMPPDIPNPSGDVQYILDGGALLHRIAWNRGSTYYDICQAYVKYVTSHYGRAVVVFDGYHEGPSTKEATHRRRSLKHTVTATVHVSGSMVFQGIRDDFLSNAVNKHIN